MSNIIGKDIKERKLGIANFYIKIHILRSLIFLNLFLINSTKHKLILLLVSSMSVYIKHNFKKF